MRAQVLPDGQVRMAAGAPGERARLLKLGEVDRPIAFSEPMLSPAFEPAYRFALDRPDSLEATLAAFEAWLLPKSSLLWLAARLVDARKSLAQQVYHVVDAGTLLAVVDRAGELGVCAGCTSARLARAEWLSRPRAAAFIPQRFRKCSVAELVWSYMLRSPAAVLPAHCRREKLFFRRPPRVQPQLVGHEHVRIMKELASAPATLNELKVRTGWRGEAIERGLSALYFAGCITSSGVKPGSRQHSRTSGQEPRPFAQSEQA